jgi:nitrate/nitrite transport system ATP-binding protein
VVFQSPNLFPWLTAIVNFAIGLDRVYPKATQAERQEVVEYDLERVGLADAMDRMAADMSNGMRQRLGIARVLRYRPSLCCGMSPLACWTA